MIFWIRRFAKILGSITFFCIMILHFFEQDPLSYTVLIPAFFRALMGASLIWFAGFIIGDIFFKGVLTDIDLDKSNLLEGGLVQQIHLKKEKNVPGGEEMPFEFQKKMKNDKKKKATPK